MGHIKQVLGINQTLGVTHKLHLLFPGSLSNLAHHPKNDNVTYGKDFFSEKYIFLLFNSSAIRPKKCFLIKI